MATRHHLPAFVSGDVAPVATGGWAGLNPSPAYLAVGRVGSPDAVTPFTPSSSAITLNFGDRAYVSPPRAGPGTLSGTVKAYALAKSTSGTVLTRFEVYVVSEDGATLRGVALPAGGYGSGAALSSGAARSAAFALAGTALTPVASLDGDRTVCVFGFSAATGAAQITYGDQVVPTTVADLVESEVQTSGVGWVEFSQDTPFWVASVTDLFSGGPLATVASYTTTATFAPTAGQVLLLTVGSNDPSPVIPSSVASLAAPALTWVMAVSSVFGSAIDSAWYAVVPSPAPPASAITVLWPGSQQESTVVVQVVDGLRTSAPIRAAGVGGGTYPLTVPLPAVPATNGTMVVTFDTVTTSGHGHAPELGWGQRLSPVARLGRPMFVGFLPRADATPSVLPGDNPGPSGAALAYSLQTARPEVTCTRGAIAVTDVTPAPGTPLAPRQGVGFTVSDDAQAFARILPRVRYPNLGRGEFVHDGDSFLPPFAGSTRTLLSGPGDPESWRYDLVRPDPWPDRVIQLAPFAFDLTGSETAPYAPPGPTPGACPAHGVVAVTPLSPTPGSRIKAADHLVLTIADSLWAFRRVLPGIDFPSLGRREFVHDGDAFEVAFRESTRALISAPGQPEVWLYDLAYSGGWPDTRVRLFPYAFDVAGGAS